MITLKLRPGKLGHKGLRYDVLLDDEMIVEASIDPEYEAARALKARGLTGSFQTVGWDDRVKMTFPDIEIAARYAITEGEKRGPILQKYVPYELRRRKDALKSTGGEEDAPDEE